MRWLCSLALCCLFAPSALFADGLLYQLPKDGASAKYDMTMKISEMGKDIKVTGTLAVASVGQIEVEGQPCRWIEFNLKLAFDNKEKSSTGKFLIPEKFLKAGWDPGATMIRGWIKDHEEPEEVMAANNPRVGPYQFFLAGPLQNPKKLAKQTLEIKSLGKVETEGETGHNSFNQGRVQFEVKSENRIHPKAPFGLVQTRMECHGFINGRASSQLTIDLKLIEVGQDAKSTLPNQK